MARSEQLVEDDLDEGHAEAKKQKTSAEENTSDDGPMPPSHQQHQPAFVAKQDMTMDQFQDKVEQFQIAMDAASNEVTQIKLQAGLAQAETEEATIQA